MSPQEPGLKLYHCQVCGEDKPPGHFYKPSSGICRTCQRRGSRVDRSQTDIKSRLMIIKTEAERRAEEYKPTQVEVETVDQESLQEVCPRCGQEYEPWQYCGGKLQAVRHQGLCDTCRATPLEMREQPKAKNSSTVVIDFVGQEGLLEALRLLAGDEIRTLNGQILWILRDHIEYVREVSRATLDAAISQDAPVPSGKECRFRD